MGSAKRVLLDTNVLIYATLESDHRFARSQEVLLGNDPWQRFISVQNLAEMYPNLTGPKMTKPDTPAMARAKIHSIASLRTLEVLPITGDIIATALELCERYDVRRQRYFDIQLIASMKAHGIKEIMTENVRDFSDFDGVHAFTPYR